MSSGRMRRVIFTLGDTVEVSVHHLDDREINTLKSLAEEGRLKLTGVAYEEATKTKRREWLKRR